MEKDDFKKRLEDLAREREEKQKALFEKQARAREELMAAKLVNKDKFNSFKRDVVYRIVEESKKAFQNSGDTILLYDNEHASSFEDRIKIFFQVLYYYKGRPVSVVGRNTPSILYDLKENTGTISVFRNFGVLNIKNKTKEININDLNKEYFQNEMLEFLQALNQN